MHRSRYDWSDLWSPITVTTAGGVLNVSGTGPIKVGQAKFYGANLLCELDAVNEYLLRGMNTPFRYLSLPLLLGLVMTNSLSGVRRYYIDETAHKLYFYPPVPLAQWTEGVYITQNMTAASIDADHITLKGLAIRASRGNGVEAINHTGVTIESCDISGHGRNCTRNLPLLVLLGGRFGRNSLLCFLSGCF